MRTARLFTVSRSIQWEGGVCIGGCWADPPVIRQTGVKTLPCPKLPLRGVNNIIVGSESRLSGCFRRFAKIFEEGQGPTNGTLLLYECRMGGGSTQTLTAEIKNFD